MSISRKTFNTVKDILKELDERRSASRPEPAAAESSRNRATPKRLDADGDRTPERRPADDGPSRNGVSDQLIG